MLYILAFAAGLIVMDTMWAWRMGIPQALYYRFKNRNRPQDTLGEDQ